VALRVAAQVHEMRCASISGNMRTNGFSAFYTLKDKRISTSGRRGVSDSQRFFNGNDMTKKFTLSCY
jgi:hypothetical protein